MTTESHDGEVTWEASEYIHHEKGPTWYLIFGIVAFAVVAGTYLLLEDIISIIVVTMMAVTVVIFANRKPRSLKYKLDDEGVTIEARSYPFETFKSYSIMTYGAVESVYLEPVERFMPPISIYFAPEDGAKIIDQFARFLPHREREPDLIDQLIHRIRL